MSHETRYVAALHNPDFRNPTTGRLMPNDTGWQTRHQQALNAPRGFECAIVGALDAWARYADEHSARYGIKVGHDGAAGEHWADIGRGILGLLNCETGRLDCGTLDGFIRNTLQFEGFGES